MIRTLPRANGCSAAPARPPIPKRTLESAFSFQALQRAKRQALGTVLLTHISSFTKNLGKGKRCPEIYLPAPVSELRAGVEESESTRQEPSVLVVVIKLIGQGSTARKAEIIAMNWSRYV